MHGYQVCYTAPPAALSRKKARKRASISSAFMSYVVWHTLVHNMAEPPAPLSNVQKLKLQLFHRLRRCHRGAWTRYWSSFQSYLVAKLTLDDFHILAEELLGPDKHLHNKFVVALLSTAYLEKDDVKVRHSPHPHPTQQLQTHNEDDTMTANEGTSPTSRGDSALNFRSLEQKDIRCDSEQRLQQKIKRSVGHKRPHSSIASIDSNAEEAAVKKLIRLSHDGSLDVYDHSDHHSAELLMGLAATTISPSLQSSNRD